MKSNHQIDRAHRKETRDTGSGSVASEGFGRALVRFGW
jgi:hypothetical protein